MISYSKQYIDKKDIIAVNSVLTGDFITQGKKILEFENSLKKYFGSKYCLVLSNATIALYLLAKALGWKKNDIVICSPNSFLSASNATLISGAKPYFVDIESNTGNLDINVLQKKITELKKKKLKIKAIIVTDFGGMPSDWSVLKKIGEKNKITLINDNCHAMGAKYNNSKQYAAKYSDYVIHSYHAAKNITTGEGGSILSNHKSVIDKIKLLRTHGVIKTPKKFPWYYEMHQLGYNARITDFQCALGISQLKKLDKIVKRKKEIAQIYNHNFSKIKNLKIPPVFKNKVSAFHLYPLRINFTKLKISKTFFFNLLKKKGINLQVHYIPIYKQPYYKKLFKFQDKDFKQTEDFYSSEVSLPLYYLLKKKQIMHVVKQIKNVMIKYND